MAIEITFIGLLLSLLYTGITGLYPGGVIVPAYLALFVDQPLRLLGTLLVALLTVFTFRLFAHFLILFGRRRFVFLVLIGGCWTLLWLTVIPGLFPQSIEFRVIGWVIPGLIANHFERQGILLTSASLITVTTLTFFLYQLAGVVFL